MKEDVRQAGSNFSTLEKVIAFSSFVTSGEKTEQDISSCTKLLAFIIHIGFFFFFSPADSHLLSELHAEKTFETFEQQQPETHFPTTHADQGAIKLEQPTALGLSVRP